jgi:AcrR family transcriptional regulator
LNVPVSRKERERAVREELILEHGRRLLVREGFQNLNLDQLAKAIEYSKGTIYLHFKTKEDLALAIATRALRERADLFERASRFTGKTRERMRAIGFACCEFAASNREYFHIEMMLKSASFWEKSSEERRRQHGIQSGRLYHIVTPIVTEALRCGDLAPHLSANEVTLSLIAVTMGSHIAAMEPDLQMLFAIEDPLAVVRRNQDVICDGWGWKPLLGEWDYAETDRRIRAEIFPHCKWYRDH